MAIEPDDILTDAALKRIEESIRQAELGTSGEIRVHIDDVCAENVLDHAAFVFSELNMQRTELRNGVLIYLSMEDHKLAIIGDAGINRLVGPTFWNEANETMIGFFREGKYIEGICAGVSMVGHQIKQHFPYEKGDVNELTNQVSLGKRKGTTR